MSNETFSRLERRRAARLACEVESIEAIRRQARSQLSTTHHRPSAVSLHFLPPKTRLDGPICFTVSQLCRRWQLGRKTVYKFIQARVLPAWRIGSHLYRVAEEDVLRFEVRNRLFHDLSEDRD